MNLLKEIIILYIMKNILNNHEGRKKLLIYQFLREVNTKIT